MWNVNVNDITDKMTIRVTGIDGKAPGKNVRISTFDGAFPFRRDNLREEDNWGNYVDNTNDIIFDRGIGTLINLQQGEIPSSIWGMPVKAIVGEGTFTSTDTFDARRISRLDVPDSVTFIGSDAIVMGRTAGSTVRIGANVNFQNGEGFASYYNKNGKKAGTYTLEYKRKGWEWSYSPKR
jgi:hypothetical protein